MAVKLYDLAQAGTKNESLVFFAARKEGEGSDGQAERFLTVITEQQGKATELQCSSNHQFSPYLASASLVIRKQHITL